MPPSLACCPHTLESPLPARCRRQGCVATEVCKRWERFRLMKFGVEKNEQRSTTAFRFFQRTSALIEHTILEADPDHPALDIVAQELQLVLCGLNPAALMGLAVRHVPLSDEALHAVSQLGQLRELCIIQDGPATPDGGLAAAIGQMQHLEAFQFGAGAVPATLVAALGRLPRLADLDLSSKERPLPSLEGLAALAGSLTSLLLQERESKSAGLKVPLLASFPKLALLCVTAPMLQVCTVAHVLRMWSHISNLH